MGFSFDGRGEKKRARRRVSAQEEDGARLIGGIRHVGSGAIKYLKSDASSRSWQQESKQTEKESLALKLEWLDKISREAKKQDKNPMLFLRFTNVSKFVTVDSDWVVIPARIFRAMDGRCRDAG